MSFKLNLSIFKSTKPESKVDFSGMMNIKVEELDAFCRFDLVVGSKAGQQHPSSQSYQGCTRGLCVKVTGFK